MDDLGVSLFLETPIYIYIYIHTYIRVFWAAHRLGYRVNNLSYGKWFFVISSPQYYVQAESDECVWKPNQQKERHTHMHTWNPNDLYFWRSTPQNKAFSNQNKGHLGSRYTYHLAFFVVPITRSPQFDDHFHQPFSLAPPMDQGRDIWKKGMS